MGGMRPPVPAGPGGRRAQPGRAGRAAPSALLDARNAQLAEARPAGSGDIHGFEIGMPLELIDDLSAKITELDERIEAELENVPGLGGVCTSRGQPVAESARGTGRGEPVLGVIARLDEIDGIGRAAAEGHCRQAWDRHDPSPHPGTPPPGKALTPRAIESGADQERPLAPGKVPVPAGATGVGAMTAARKRHLPRRPVPAPRPQARAAELPIVAGRPTIIEIAWRVIADPGLRFIELELARTTTSSNPAARTATRSLSSKLNPGSTATSTPLLVTGRAGTPPDQSTYPPVILSPAWNAKSLYVLLQLHRLPWQHRARGRLELRPRRPPVLPVRGTSGRGDAKGAPSCYTGATEASMTTARGHLGSGLVA